MTDDQAPVVVDADDMDGPTEAPTDWADMIPINPTYEAPIPLDPEVFTPTGLNVDMATMDMDQWAVIGAHMDPLARGIQIWAGDWYAKGDAKWGEDIHQVLNAYQSGTWYNWGRVMGIITEDMRDDGLLFSHYRYAAELKNASGTPDRRGIKAALQHALDNNLNTREFQEYIRSLKGSDIGLDDGDKPGAGEITSVSISFAFRVAPADETGAKLVADQTQEYLEMLLAQGQIPTLSVTQPKVEHNRRDAE